MRISDCVAYFARRTPHAEAAVFADVRWSYADLDRRVDALAKALLAAGVVKGDRVATLQTPRPEFLSALLAAASIGAIWVGLNPKYRLAELSHVITDAEPKILLARTRIGERRYDADLRALQDACPALERIVVFDGDPLVAGAIALRDFVLGGTAVAPGDLPAARLQCGGRDPCLIVYTSGTTGRPKGAVLGHEGIIAFSETQNALWPVAPYRTLNYFPINHVGCVVDVTAPCLMAGGCLIFQEQFDPQLSLEAVVSERVSLLGSVPSVFQMQLALPDFSRYDLSGLQLIVFEGAPMPADLIGQLLRLGKNVATNYGMTETTSAITALEPTRDAELLTHTVGSAFPGVKIRLTTADGRTAAVGEIGEVWARSPYNFLGYWRDPAATAQAFSADGYFRTGDLAVQRSDGRYRLAGRVKEMFKSGGYNVYPREVETVIETHPAVTLAAVVCVPDPLWQEVGIAFVQADAPIAAADLRQWCRSRLANYKIPKRFVLLPALPLLPIGKIDKVELRRRALETAVGPAD
ncbi:MAG: class I adenylate-forming enzyme family protein [Steroidobacteraceae bacterium]